MMARGRGRRRCRDRAPADGDRGARPGTTGRMGPQHVGRAAPGTARRACRDRVALVEAKCGMRNPLDKAFNTLSPVAPKA